MQADNVIMVSVCIQTYNHASFIAQCLESVLEQKTDFNYEIIIGEDESLDGTREICIAYQQKYPDKIRLFLRSAKDKIFIDGVQTGRFNFIENIKAAKGKYIALLDGDDFWIDPLKLQKQVNMLEGNSKIVVACGKLKKLFPGGQIMEVDNRKYKSKTVFDISDTIFYSFHTMSNILFRNNRPPDFPPFLQKSFFGDLSMFWWLTRNGDQIGFVDDFLMVYRVHKGGITKTIDSVKYYNNFFYTLNQFDLLTGKKYTHQVASKKFITEFEWFCLVKPYGFRFIYFWAHLPEFIDNHKYINNKVKVTLKYLLPINSLIKQFKVGA